MALKRRIVGPMKPTAFFFPNPRLTRAAIRGILTEIAADRVLAFARSRSPIDRKRAYASLRLLRASSEPRAGS